MTARPRVARKSPSESREGRPVKGKWLQVRASESQKAIWKRAAAASGHGGLSSWVCSTLDARASDILLFG